MEKEVSARTSNRGNVPKKKNEKRRAERRRKKKGTEGEIKRRGVEEREKMRDKEEKEKRERGTMREKKEQDRFSYRIKEIQSQQAAILCCYCWRPSQDNCGPVLLA